jgi:hypothetical protein
MRYLAMLAASATLVFLIMPGRVAASTPNLCVQGQPCPRPCSPPPPGPGDVLWRPPPPHACPD